MSNNSENTAIYRKVLSSAQNKLSASIEQIRDSIPHSAEIGALIERQFRSQLEEVLPAKIGVSQGFVVDSIGNVSRQMDIILYDKLNTPRIFASDGAQMFPVEATYACGEIKTTLNASELVDSFEKCLSYKKLCRQAYIEQPGPKMTKFSLFGCDHHHWQSIFFCIAVKSVEAKSLQSKFNEIVVGKKLPVHKRVDTIIALEATGGRNILLNVAGELINGIPPNKSVHLLPRHGSNLCSYRAKEPWSLFLMLLLRYMNQASTEPIDMLAYGGDVPY